MTNPSQRASALRRNEILVVIGSSAGGPAALAKVLSAFPSDAPACFVVVQHVDARFAPPLASWLDDQVKLPVRLATAGDSLKPGSVFLSGTNDHLILRDESTLSYTTEPAACAYRPSIDILFQSAAQRWKGEIIGVLLTGMGRDGAMGLKTLRNAGHHTITQDQASSAIYGMPKAAAEISAAVEILPLEQIAPSLMKRMRLPISTLD